MNQDKDILARARTLIKERQYDRARLLLKRIPDNPTAQKWLSELERLDPKPQTFEEAQADLVDAQAELADAQQEIEETETQLQRVFRMNTAVLVFLGTLLGSLIGAAADFGEALNTFEELQARRYPELCVVGSNTVLGEGLGMAQTWEDKFEDTHDIRVNVNPVGSNSGVRLATEGKCAHVLAMSEPMNDEQYNTLVGSGVDIQCAAEIGYDIVVFVTDINNPVSVIDRRTLAGMLIGQTDNWSALSTDFDYPVTVLVREGSGTTDLVLSKIANFDSNYGTNFPPMGNYVTCDTNGECLNTTLSTNGALYWVSASWIRTQPPQYLRVLPILVSDDDAPINALNDEVDLDEYPAALQRPLYIYVVRNSTTSDEQLEAAYQFLDYVRGVEGQQILEDHHFYNYFDQPSNVDVPLPPGFDPIGVPGRAVCQPMSGTTS